VPLAAREQSASALAGLLQASLHLAITDPHSPRTDVVGVVAEELLEVVADQKAGSEQHHHRRDQRPHHQRGADDRRQAGQDAADDDHGEQQHRSEDGDRPKAQEQEVARNGAVVDSLGAAVAATLLPGGFPDHRGEEANRDQRECERADDQSQLFFTAAEVGFAREHEDIVAGTEVRNAVGRADVRSPEWVLIYLHVEVDVFIADTRLGNGRAEPRPVFCRYNTAEMVTVLGRNVIGAGNRTGPLPDRPEQGLRDDLLGMIDRRIADLHRRTRAAPGHRNADTDDAQQHFWRGHTRHGDEFIWGSLLNPDSGEGIEHIESSVRVPRQTAAPTE
jgi:hypothetical protein